MDRVFSPGAALPAVDASDAGRRRILVIDDEPTVREVVARYLENDGYHVETASGHGPAQRSLAAAPDLVILDLNLPGMDGLALLREVRRSSDVAVIVLTARGDELDRVIGLELGADDYVLKPFSPRELVARVRSVLRRGRSPAGEMRQEFAGLTIDPRSRTVVVAGRDLQLRAREFDLLSFFASNPHRVFSRGQLLEHVWHSSSAFSDVSTVTVHVRRIRQKIEIDPLEPRWIVTVRGVGYRFDP